MKHLAKFYAIYFLYWMVFWIINKIAFLAVNFNYLPDGATFRELLQIFLYGSPLDFSCCGYLLIVPTLVLIFYVIFEWQKLLILIKGYTLTMATVFAALSIVDVLLYGEWGYRIDFSVLFYLKSFKEATHFVSLSQWLTGSLLFVLILMYAWFAYSGIARLLPGKLERKWTSLLVVLALGAALIIPIRGGLGLTPINISKVYFSEVSFYNHSAINPAWNFIFSIVEKDKLTENHRFMSDAEVRTKIDQIYPLDTINTIDVLREKEPDIYLIMLESFVGGLMDEEVEGEQVLPEMNRLKKEGIYFSNFYANGDRTDKGLLSLISGYPPLPKSIIMNYPNKTAKVPSLIEDLKALNYESRFYYGGDVNFANMKSYLLSKGIGELIDNRSFDEGSKSAKWGVHDQVVFDRLKKDIEKDRAAQPQFNILLTLSSHPPFDIPGPTRFPGSSSKIQFLNAANYTDKVVGEFIDWFKTTDQWENSLVILVADHGVNYLDDCLVFEARKFKIPMIWLGGALSVTGREIDRYASQTDVPYSLLNQLGVHNEKYVFSKNVFSDQARSFSFYTFNNGFGFLSNQTKIVYELNNEHYAYRDLSSELFPDEICKAYMQYLSLDYNKR